MNKVNIEEIKQALAAATPDWHYNGNEIVSLQNKRCGIGGFLKEEDNELAVNAPTWLAQLLEERKVMVNALNWIADRSTNHLGAVTKAEVALNKVGELE